MYVMNWTSASQENKCANMSVFPALNNGLMLMYNGVYFMFVGLLL